MSEEQYKKYITQMLGYIHDEKELKKIYNYVHRRFINRLDLPEEKYGKN